METTASPETADKKHPYVTPKFAVGDPVIHVKSRKPYIIRHLPTHNRLESTGEPAYGYSNGDGINWWRSQTEMEDGRFELNRVLPRSVD